MAIDWGDIIYGAGTGILGGLTGQGPSGFAGPSPVVRPALPPGPAGMPAQVTVDTRTGQIKPCRRRRRRRLLTPTDLSDLAALQALVGKGSSSLNMAVAKAVRR